MADVDIESEKWRRIGEARFVLGELHRKPSLTPRPAAFNIPVCKSTEMEDIG